MSREKVVFFHVDIDSPKTLARFWGLPADTADVDAFYEKAMDRALSVFAKAGVSATFFCVGAELDSSAAARKKIRQAFDAGHEIANHTQTHPYGLSHMDKSDIEYEIEQCSLAVERVIGKRPIGFRAPSYDLSRDVLDVLEKLSFSYDSSAAWNSLQPLMKARHALFSKKEMRGEFGSGRPTIPTEAYFPTKSDWMKKNADGKGLVEIPLPRTSLLGLPFYNNFHLMAGS